MITPDQFRVELARRLNEVLPEGFHATPTRDGIYLETPDGLGTSGWTGQVDRDPANPDSYRDAGWNVLSSVQDCVAVTIREVWPMETTEPEHRMAYPGSKVEDTVLYIWYGPEENPTLRLRPIELTGETG